MPCPLISSFRDCLPYWPFFLYPPPFFICHLFSPRNSLPLFASTTLRKLSFFFCQLSILSIIQLLTSATVNVFQMFMFTAFTISSFFSLKNACLACAVRQFISVALFSSHVTLLQRYVKLFTFFNFIVFIVYAWRLLAVYYKLVSFSNRDVHVKMGRFWFLKHCNHSNLKIVTIIKLIKNCIQYRRFYDCNYLKHRDMYEIN